MAITKLTYYTKQPKRLMHILLAFDPRILLQLLLLCHVLDFKNLIDWSLSSLMSNEGFYAIVIHYSLTWARNESIFSFLLYYMTCYFTKKLSATNIFQNHKCFLLNWYGIKNREDINGRVSVILLIQLLLSICKWLESVPFNSVTWSFNQ